MLKKFTPKLLILFVIVIFTIFYFLINLSIGNENYISKKLKSLLNHEKRQVIKKYVFPYKAISKQEQTISQLQQKLSENEMKLNLGITNLELKVKEKGYVIETYKKNIQLSEVKLDKNNTLFLKDKILKKYKLAKGFYAGINNVFPGSGYINFHQSNVIILSSRGILAFKKNIEDNEENFKQIKNNINEFISKDQFKKSSNQWFSLKDLYIHNDKVFISFTEEIKEDCWNTSIIYGDFNYKNIKFEKLFSPNECVHSKENIDKEFNAHQSGGKITLFDKNHILLSIGDYRSRYLAQVKNSVNGKIIKVNIDSGAYEIVSMGHRNPQGLYLDKENNFILETEHGPFGGDEINIIEVNKIGKKNIQNFGWAISSYGEHYGGKSSANNVSKYQKYPLYKSHAEQGFIEPLKSFVPSIGISAIVKISQNSYVVSSLRKKHLYFFKLSNQKQITNLNKVDVFERVRDLRFHKNKLYLFMEDSASIGTIDLI